MTRLLLIRHPQTDWNVDGRYQGQTDVPLNDAGRLQAKALGVALSGTRLDAVYTSDLQRARFVAEIIADATGAPLVFDLRLRELDQGEWEGLLGGDVRARWPGLHTLRRQDPLAFAPPGGEPLVDFRARVMAAISDIQRAHPDGVVAVVSHGLSLAVVRVELGGLPMAGVWDLIPPNCEVLEIDA